MSSSAPQQPPPGPPYPPRIAQMGGTPSVGVDVPIASVLLALFVTSAAINMTIFQINRRRGHKFIPSGALFGFSVARSVACSLHIAEAVHPDNVSLLIAGTIFFRAGVIILFILNLIFLQRILRALHPHVGWHPAAGWLFKFLYFSIVANLVMTIVTVVYSYFTLDMSTQLRLRDVMYTSSIFLAVLAVLPLPGILLCFVLPRRVPVDHFGQGSMRTKIIVLLVTTTLLSLGATFRAATSFMPHAISNPGWINSRGSYYGFNYVIELIVVIIYVSVRFDKRFHIPNGSFAPGHYSNGVPKEEHQKSRSSDDEDLVASLPPSKEAGAETTV